MIVYIVCIPHLWVYYSMQLGFAIHIVYDYGMFYGLKSHFVGIVIM